MLRLAGQITRENNPELFAVLDQLNLSIVIFSASGVLLYGNQQANQLANMGGKELPGTLIWDLPIWNDPQKTKKNFFRFIKILEREKSFSFELKIPDGKNNRVIHFELTPFFNTVGELESVIAQGQDVTAYHHVEDQLKAQKQLLSVTVDSAPLVLFVVDRNGIVRLSAGKARQLLKDRRLHSLGKHIKDIYADHPEVIQNIARAMSGEQFGTQLRLMDLVFEVSYAPLYDENGEIIGVVGVATDMTSQAQIEAELEETQHRLIQASETERLRLAQDLHDGPLQEIIAITYQLQTLEAGLTHTQDYETLKNVQDALQDAVRSVRIFCSELRPPTLAPFGLEKAIRSYAEQYQKMHPETLILMDLDSDKQSLPEMTRLTLFRIFQEAMNNVWRHAEATLVRVRLSLTDTNITLEIKDNGKGFVIPSRWVTMARQGHLGLVGAMERAQGLGGNLHITTNPGEGVTLQVSVKRPEGKLKEE
ncbi:MAG: hypothetical protein CVU39_08210 [Chloroflexi bacterium HGW-Chloroflexi-10]|nr:MAG: hypothetical protein CVU39_08210 [Chloroflexi bacterium HGW-Chloroflexi-10]